MTSDADPPTTTPAPDTADVRTLARLAGLPIPDTEVEAVLAPLQAMYEARALVDGWRAEGGEG